MTVYLSAESVQKKYGKEYALKDASLKLYQGEIFALLGPNGAGKTTLLKILSTLLAKDSGRIEIFGYDLDRDLDEIRHLFGYVGQDTERSAYARLTASENLRFFGALRGLDRKLIDRRIDLLAGYFDFGDNLDHQFMHLSGGQKQTVVIIRALLHDPPLIFLDEPTKGLDPIVAKKIRAFLKRYVQQEEKSLLLTSHILSEVEELADRVALIHRGRISVAGTPQDLKNTVGAAEFVEIEKDGIPARTGQGILELQSVLFQVDRVPGWLSYGVSDPLDGMEAIIDLLRRSNIRTRLRHQAVSLEDAFVHQVGELNENFDS
ncbi:MAG: ABC transporter ATP-binding protein [Proteobacteria bacterium]|nr:ABC transporter ATP-binding protein [Pseudomonadota bacterium]